MVEMKTIKLLRNLFYAAGIFAFICVGIASIHYIDEYVFMTQANEFKYDLLIKEERVIQTADSIIKANNLNTPEYNEQFNDMWDLINTQL